MKLFKEYRKLIFILAGYDLLATAGYIPPSPFQKKLCYFTSRLCYIVLTTAFVFFGGFFIFEAHTFNDFAENFNEFATLLNNTVIIISYQWRGVIALKWIEAVENFIEERKFSFACISKTSKI